MPSTPPEPPEGQSLLQALSPVLEAAATLVPLVAVIAGIGMMTTLPPASSAPIFASNSDARSFFEQHDLGWYPEIPLVLSRDDCSRCDVLRSELLEAGIRFSERNIQNDAGAAQLFEAARLVTREEQLPLVIVERNLITPRVRSIRMALSRK